MPSFDSPDPRARADQHDAELCEWCGRAIRWVRNTSSAREGAHLQIVARPLARGRWYDEERHLGMIAVDEYGDGRALGRAARRGELDDTWLYRCHWDVCEQSRAQRDHRSAQLRAARPTAVGPEERNAAQLAAERFAAWRRDSGA